MIDAEHRKAAKHLNVWRMKAMPLMALHFDAMGGMEWGYRIRG